MMKAIWNGAVLAESEETVVVEGNHYFPVDSVKRKFLAPSEHHTWCGWKGKASYFDVTVDGQINRGAAWYYPEPYAAAARIQNRVAFWRGVRIVE
jgi:uncharacterized protein (DUF427 family)